MTVARRLASSFSRRLFLDRQLRFWLGELHATLSFDEVRARVVGVLAETQDVKTFVLRPNSAWRGHRAGQHALVEVEIDGVRHRRPYSISSAPGDPRVAITVKRAARGRVSAWLHACVRPGHVLRLGQAAGDFVLPHPTPAKLLFLSAGSGITPVMAMLRDLASRGEVRDLAFVHHARTRHDVIFRGDLLDLAAHHRGLRLDLRLADAGGRFDEDELRRLVPDFLERDTFLCGPPGVMERAERLWQSQGAACRLHVERFVPAVRPDGRGRGARITLARSGRSFPSAGGTLLDELERAGEGPASGCRMGICHTCKGRKRCGTVENLLTGAVSSDPDVDIQLCISVPRSDVELGL